DENRAPGLTPDPCPEEWNELHAVTSPDPANANDCRYPHGLKRSQSVAKILSLAAEIWLLSERLLYIAGLRPFESFCDRHADPRNPTPAHVRHHLPPGRGQDHAHREVAAVRRRHSDGRHREGPQGCAACDFRLDAARAAARNFGHLIGHAVSLPGLHREPAGYA